MGMVGRPPNFMKKNRLFIFLIASLALNPLLASYLYAQDRLAAGSVSLVTPEDKLHALASTRFHFITLKQFHSSLFSFVDQNKNLSEAEAGLLNAGLNAFLTSAERETMLLDALRRDKSVQVRFSICEPDEETYEMIDHPAKPLLYRLQPAVRRVPAAIEVKPLLDQPIAFQITLTKGNERHLYDVDWSGNVIQGSA
jgi:hypothetical protein